MDNVLIDLGKFIKNHKRAYELSFEDANVVKETNLFIYKDN
jgi:hypothetical protein